MWHNTGILTDPNSSNSSVAWPLKSHCGNLGSLTPRRMRTNEPQELRMQNQREAYQRSRRGAEDAANQHGSVGRSASMEGPTPESSSAASRFHLVAKTITWPNQNNLVTSLPSFIQGKTTHGLGVGGVQCITSTGTRPERFWARTNSTERLDEIMQKQNIG